MAVRSGNGNHEARTQDTQEAGANRGGWAVVIAAAFIACVLLRCGVDWVAYFFSTPTMEAPSGKKYTPVSGVRRAIEKLDERSKPQE